MTTRIILLSGIVIILSAGEFAFAGYRAPLEHSGQICLDRYTFDLKQVTHSISADYLSPACENFGGSVNLKGLKIAVDRGPGCPFGYMLSYELKGECYIP